MKEIKIYLNDFDSLKSKMILAVDYYIENKIGYDKKYNILKLFENNKSKDDINNLLNEYFCNDDDKDESTKISNLTITNEIIIFNFYLDGLSIRNTNAYHLDIVIELYKHHCGFTCKYIGKLEFKDYNGYTNKVPLDRSILFKC